MITIKIQCGCGQRYAFDVEPVNGRMVSSVACPSCGADGTSAANAIIAQTLPPEPAIAPEPPVRLHVAVPATPVQPASLAAAARRAALAGGQTDPAKIESEARAKIFWGDSPEDTVKFLMMNGSRHEDAVVLVRAMFQERSAALQRIGIRKIGAGISLMAVPVVVLLIFAHFHVIILSVFSLTVMVGLWGAWKFFKGSLLVLFPKAETGDVADL